MKLINNCKYFLPASICISLLNFKIKYPKFSTCEKSKISPYIIIGFGVAGRTAYNTIIQRDPYANILIIDKKIPDKDTFLPENVFCHGSVSSLDPSNQKIILSNGDQFNYKKLLIATGCSKINLSNMNVDFDRILIEDVASQSSRDHLIESVKIGNHVTLVGSSWNNIKLAVTLAKFARKYGYEGSVTMIMSANGPFASSIPKYLSDIIKNKLKLLKIEIIPQRFVRYIGDESILPKWANTVNASKVIYSTAVFDNHDTCVIITDKVGVDLDSLPGINLNDDFISRSGLELDLMHGGIVVNKSFMATSNIWVAGEIASIHTIIGRGTFPGECFAKESGKMAAINMSNGNELFLDVPIYDNTQQTETEISRELNELDLKLIGDCSSALESHGIWYKFIDTELKTFTSLSKDFLTSNEKSTMNTFYDNVVSNFKKIMTSEDKIPNQKLENDLINKIRGKTLLKKITLNDMNSVTEPSENDLIAKMSKVERNLNFGVIYYLNENKIIVGCVLYGMDKIASGVEKNALISHCKSIITSKININHLRESDIDCMPLLEPNKFKNKNLSNLNYDFYLGPNEVNKLEKNSNSIFSKFLSNFKELSSSKPTYKFSPAFKSAYIFDKNRNNTSLHRPRAPNSERHFIEPVREK